MFPDPRPRADAPAAPAAPGEIIGGKYEVGECIGFGGMGIVCAATHLELHRKLAIKFVRPEFSESGEFVTRFLNEARAAAQLRSKHVAQVLDCGRMPSGTPYMVLEHLEGADLETIVGTRGPLTVELAVDLALQLCEALAEAHASHIVHRDIKPQNLFVVDGPGGSPVLKVLDFGVSKRLFAGDPSVTQTSHGVGSPHYMSPEQMTSPSEVDARTDIWSVGAVLFELLAARPPFTGETLPEVCAKVVTQPAPYIRSFRPNVPPRLEAVVQRCLEKDREQRYSDVAELAEGLSPFASPLGLASVDLVARILGREPPRRSIAAVVMVEDEAPSHVRGRPAPIPGVRKSRVPLLIAIGLLGGATLFGAGGLMLGGVRLDSTTELDSLDAGAVLDPALGARPLPTSLPVASAVAPRASGTRQVDVPAQATATAATPHPSRSPRHDAGSSSSAKPRETAKTPGDPRDIDPPGIGDMPVLTPPPEMDPTPKLQER